MGAALLAFGGEDTRRGVARGAAGAALAGVVANFVLKPMFDRKRPVRARRREHPPKTSSFPSGHSAVQLAFMLGVAEADPRLALPLTAMTAISHWSLVRSRSHYLSDVIAGWVIGLAANLLVALTWGRLSHSVARWLGVHSLRGFVR